MLATKAKGVSRVTAGIVIAAISAVGAILAAKVTASSTTDGALTDLKLETTSKIGALEGRVSSVEAVNKEINKHLTNIDGSLQSITSYLLNKK